MQDASIEPMLWPIPLPAAAAREKPKDWLVMPYEIDLYIFMLSQKKRQTVHTDPAAPTACTLFVLNNCNYFAS